MPVDNVTELLRDPLLGQIITKGGIPNSTITISSGRAQGSNQENRAEIKGNDITIAQSDAPRQIVYGTMRFGGIYSFLQMNLGASGEFFHIVVTVAGHKIHSIDKLILDDIEVDFGGGTYFTDPRWGLANTVWDDKVFMSVSDGDVDQPANADLVAQSNILFPGKWTDLHRQRGCAHAYLILVYDSLLFPNGPPKIDFEGRGKADIYDFRTLTTVPYTNNAVLLIADYLRDPLLGYGYQLTEFDTDQIAEAADIADEDVPLVGGGTEKRYTINGVFDSSDDSILEQMVTAIAGDVVYSGGKWRIYPAKWRPPTIVLTADDLRSGVRISTHIGRRDAFNAIKGTYISPERVWQITDFPGVQNSTYQLEDGATIWEDVTFPCTTSSATCQRLAKIQLERSRQGILVEADWSFAAYQVQTGDTVVLRLPHFGWTSKAFEVREVRLSANPTSGQIEFVVSLILREAGTGIYDWNLGEETTVDVAPNTDLPDPSHVIEPSGLLLTSGTSELYLRADGTVFTRLRVAWTSPADPFVNPNGHFELQYKRTIDAMWLQATTVPGSTTLAYILDVQDDQFYDVRIRSVNGLGNTSPWTTSLGHFVEGKTQNPSDVSGFTAMVEGYNIVLSWTAIPDLDRLHYEIREGDTWAGGTKIYEANATRFRWSPQVVGPYRFMLRAVDTSGNLSTFAAVATTAVNAAPGPVVDTQLAGPSVVFTWAPIPATPFAIAEYEIRAGDAFEWSTLQDTSKTTTYQTVVTWAGTRRFWFAARDIAGNVGAYVSEDVVISAPGVIQNLLAEVISNDVLLRWETPLTGSLPIDYYRVYKGASFGAATPIYETRGTFAPLPERAGGSYTYWIQPVDTAQNGGTPTGVTVSVSQPTDYTLYADQLIDLGTLTLVNAIVEADAVLLPVNTIETWEQHYSDMSWTTFQEQIDDGYLTFLLPSTVAPGTLETTIDLGATLAAAIITFEWLATVISSAVTIVPRIGYSADNVTFTYADTASLLGSSFRYVKLKITGTGADQMGLVKLSQLRLRVAVREETDAGMGTTDGSGVATVTFNKAFADVSALWVTPAHHASYRVHATYTFIDVPNPTTFDVNLYRLDTGAAVANGFSWGARGVVA